MIEQQINLYQERFRERRLWISAAQTAAALLLLLLLAGVASFLLQTDLDR